MLKTTLLLTILQLTHKYKEKSDTLVDSSPVTRNIYPALKGYLFLQDKWRKRHKVRKCTRYF